VFDAGLIGPWTGELRSCKAALAMMAIAIDNEMAKYGVAANSIAPLARTRLTTDATPSSAPMFGREVKPGEFDVFGLKTFPADRLARERRRQGRAREVFRVGAGPCGS